MQSSVSKHIKKWIKEVSEKHTSLNGHSVCPFAKTAKYNIIELVDTNAFVPDCGRFELILYILPHSYSLEDVENFTDCCNIKFPEFIFIPDPREKATFIKNVQTNNCVYNIVFCQPRAKMSLARLHLKKIGYYENWTTEQLQNIMKDDHTKFISKCPYTNTKNIIKNILASLLSRLQQTRSIKDLTKSNNE